MDQTKPTAHHFRVFAISDTFKVTLRTAQFFAGDFDPQQVSGLNKTLICNVLRFAEQDHRRREVQRVADQPLGGLYQSLQHEHAGKNRKGGKMIGQIFLGESHRLDGDDARAPLMLNHPVDQIEFHGSICSVG